MKSSYIKNKNHEGFTRATRLQEPSAGGKVELESLLHNRVLFGLVQKGD